MTKPRPMPRRRRLSISWRRLQALDTATKGAEFRKLYEDVQTGLTGYQVVADKATGINRKMDDLANSTMREMGGKVID